MATSAEEHVLVEARRRAGVARRSLLVHDQQHGVAVAVEADLVHVLGVTRGLALHPEPAPAAGEVRRAPGGQGEVQCLVVHPGHHENLAGPLALRHRAHQPVGVALESLGDRGVQGRHRTSTPAARRASLTSPMRSCPKWNTLAASTASAPASTAGGKCSTAPAPPLAMSGTSTAARTSLISSRSKPAFVPSASIEFSRISPTPSSWPRAAHSTASIPVPVRPPCVVTSKPDAVSARRASTDRTMHWAPKRCEHSPSSSGRRIAAVLMLTLSAPARS